jgi:tRNA(Ile)-lysidine synthase
MTSGRKRDWRAVAEAMATAIPVTRLHPRAVAAGGAEGGKWAVAFSGGADSLALLLLLWAHFPKRRRGLVALHFDHRLRGRASTADAAFCAKVCAGLGVRFESETWSNRPAKPISEAMARDARREFFDGVLKRLRARVLWLGHQQDDIAETMFMRLGRGSGTAGLSAPRPAQGLENGRIHLRPLLTLKKAELTAALRVSGAHWREDQSNGTDDFLRNRMRRAVIPAWCAAHRERDAFAGAALSRERLDEDDEALETWRQELAPVNEDGQLDLRPLAGRPRALIRRALQAWLLAQPDTGDLSRQGFDALLAAVEAGRSTRFSLGRAGFALIRRGWLRYETSSRR